MVKFNSFSSASLYITKLGYVLTDSHSFKTEGAYFYRHKYSKNKHIYLNKKIDYVDNDSLNRGVVYTLNYI